MPWKMWKHFCGMENRTILQGREICDYCHQVGEYDGPRYSMIEAMGAYQAHTGLKPIGPHRKLADELFQQRFRACERCLNNGVIDYCNGDGYIICGDCHGSGWIFEGSQQEWEAIREQVILSFPYALADPAIFTKSENQVFMFLPIPEGKYDRLDSF